MATARRIGWTQRSATDWTQDVLRTTRPIAEATLQSLLADGIALVTAQGILLLEDDEEVHRRARSVLSRTPHSRLRRRSRLREHRSDFQARQIVPDDDSPPTLANLLAGYTTPE